MPKTLTPEPQPFTVDEFLSEDADLPHKMELINGVIGPYSDAGKRTLLANWGADKIVALTGPEIWREASPRWRRNNFTPSARRASP